MRHYHYALGSEREKKQMLPGEKSSESTHIKNKQTKEEQEMIYVDPGSQKKIMLYRKVTIQEFLIQLFNIQHLGGEEILFKKC